MVKHQHRKITQHLCTIVDNTSLFWHKWTPQVAKLLLSILPSITLLVTPTHFIVLGKNKTSILHHAEDGGPHIQL